MLNPLIKSTAVLLNLILSIWYCFVVSTAYRFIDCLLSWVSPGLFWHFHGGRKADNLLSFFSLLRVRINPVCSCWQHHDIMSLGHNVSKNMAFKSHSLNFMSYEKAPGDSVTISNCWFGFFHNYLKEKTCSTFKLETQANSSILEFCCLSSAFPQGFI